MRRVIGALVLSAILAGSAAPAGAVFPGSNGAIAFIRFERLLRMEADGSGVERLASGAANPAWAADGARIAFSGRRRSGRTDIFVVDADGSGATALTRFRPGFNLTPSWSPDGSTIVFRHNDEEGDDLYTVSSDGSALTRLTTSPRIVESAPEWSPDGSRILFSRVRARSPLAEEELYIMNADGSGLVRLTDNGVPDFQPSWSPDGTRIVFVRESSTLGAKAFAMNADGSAATRLTDDAIEEFWPSFSPDGTRIVVARCVDFSCDLVMLDPDGSDPVALTHGPRLESQPDWQPVV
jgi:TolB protein